MDFTGKTVIHESGNTKYIVKWQLGKIVLLFIENNPITYCSINNIREV